MNKKIEMKERRNKEKDINVLKGKKSAKQGKRRRRKRIKLTPVV